MLRPDYNNSIVNLVSSLVTILGGDNRGYKPLESFREPESSKNPLVLLIIDGLGDCFLHHYPDSFLFRYRRGKISSVFPSTTATAITSFFTGVGPQQHGITGWYTFFKELGTVATVLPFHPRYGGPSFSENAVSPSQLTGSGSLLNFLDTPCHVILPHYLIDSAYSLTLSGKAKRHKYNNLAKMFKIINSLTATEKDGLIIAYWPELDSLAHKRGINSSEMKALFLDLDHHCRSSLPLAIKNGATVFVSADHGMIDTSEDRTIYLEDHPRLAATLALPLCGDSRCAYCYVRPERRIDFESYVDNKLAFACELKRSRDLIREGYYGQGPAFPGLEERIGDYALLMKENYILKDTLLTEERSVQKGVHGGITEEELYVPLIVI